MRLAPLMATAGTVLALAACTTTSDSDKTGPKKTDSASVQIMLDVNEPSKSTGILTSGEIQHAFPVGYGKYGIACSDTSFSEGLTPLGRFRVNAVLTENSFKMDEKLIEASGKSEDYLRKNLFKNMNSIDFKGDGETKEYGRGYISLAPVSSTPQPFAFNQYAGTFRWYSFAIHGTNNESRVGQKVTGGCLNVGSKDLETLLDTLELGDEVNITANGPCQA